MIYWDIYAQIAFITLLTTLSWYESYELHSFIAGEGSNSVLHVWFESQKSIIVGNSQNI